MAKPQEKIPTLATKTAKVGTSTQSQNHPQPGSTIRVEPIRKTKDISLLKRLLADRPRDLCIFITGINTNLRASDLLSIRVGDVKHLAIGESFTLRERKTSKLRMITLNPAVHAAKKGLLATRPSAKDNDYLFVSQKTGTKLTVSYLSQLVKNWCQQINLPGILAQGGSLDQPHREDNMSIYGPLCQALILSPSVS